MAFIKLIMTASKLNKLKTELTEEKTDAIAISKKQHVKKKCKHFPILLRYKMKKFLKKLLSCFIFGKFCYAVRHDGSCENYTLKSIVGFVCGFMLTYLFFMFAMFRLNFSLPTATVFCSILGCILMIGLAFSTKVRCVVLLILPQFFSQKGRQALLAYAFILCISGPSRNILNNMGILGDSLACGQEQLRQAVMQIIDVIKKPFLAIKEAIKTVVKTVKEIVKKIKEVLLTIKRVIMAILKVIKAAFQFLAKIINICNKEFGTPFDRCTRVFENAIVDCNAKLGPLFSWLCSLTYLVQSVCYLVKFLDLICIIVDFISDSIVGVVIRKVKTFIRHIKTMFYVRIRFYHSFEFHQNSSKTVKEIGHEMMVEINQRTEFLRALFHFITSAATIFFLFIIFKVTYYRFRFLTSERFDNKYINKDFRAIDMKRAKLGKETVLPLNKREAEIYVTVNSAKLAKSEKKALAKSASVLATASGKLAIFMASDYCLFWVLNLIQYYGKFQSKVPAPNMPTVQVAGKGFFADLLRSIVNAFQPAGIKLEIDTIPCLPTPIPPDYDRYVQIATILLLCWVLTLLEPYGLRLRHTVMCYYHPIRAKERSIWLYNHLIRSRNSFLKFARRQLRRKVLGNGSIAKVTCKEFLAANFKVCRFCLGDGIQTCCLLCGEVFRESDDKKPIKCHTPGCPGIYCEQCFADLQNLCTVCLSPIEYGDLSDISEEKDSSEEEPRTIKQKEKKIKTCCKKCKWCKWCKWFSCSKCCDSCCLDDDDHDEDTIKSKSTSKTKILFKKRSTDDKSFSDEESKLLTDEDHTDVQNEKYEKDDKIDKTKDSDYYSSDNSTDYSYSYQYDKTHESTPAPVVTPFKDIEKQDVPDYASMSSFREEEDESLVQEMLDKSTTTVKNQTLGTAISGTTFKENKKGRKVEFLGVSDKSRTTIRKKKRKKRKSRVAEERPLLEESSSCACSESDDNDQIPHLQSPVLTFLRSTSSSIIYEKDIPNSSSEDIVELSSWSVIGTETLSDIKEAQALVPELDLSHCQGYHVPTSASTTPDGHEHNFIEVVPESNLPLQTTVTSPKNYIQNIFGNMKYEEVSETPRSTSTSSKDESFSPDVSSVEQTTQIISQDKTKLDKSTSTDTTKTTVDVGVSAKPEEKYKFEEKQRKKVNQYYKALKNTACCKTEERKKPGKIMKFVQKIIPKRKRNTDVLPFHSTNNNEEEIELNTFSYSKDPWDVASSSSLLSAIHRQRAIAREHNISSEENEDRVRGGEGGRIQNYSSTLTRCDTEETSWTETDTTFSVSYEDYPKPPFIAKELLAKYFVSIEDLTPTRDIDIPMTTIGPSKGYCCLEEEFPEKDVPQGQNKKRQLKSSASENFSTHGIQTSSSSNLSEALCASILGVPCTLDDYRRVYSTSENPKRSDKRERENLPSIQEAEALDDTYKASEEKYYDRKSEHKSQPNLPVTKSLPSKISKYCSCDTIVNKDGEAQTCPLSILKKQRLQQQTSEDKSEATSTSNIMEKPTKDKTVATAETGDKTKSGKKPNTDKSNNKMQQTSDISVCSSTESITKTPRYDGSSSSYCECQCYQPSRSQCSHSCCKCPPTPPTYENFVNLRDLDYEPPPRRSYQNCMERRQQYPSEVPSECTVRSERRPTVTRKNFMEYPDDSGYSLRGYGYRDQGYRKNSTDTYTLDSYPCRPRPKRPKPKQNPGTGNVCPCSGDCRGCIERRQSPPHIPQCRYMDYRSIPNSDLEEEDEDDEEEEDDYYHDPHPNPHDLPYQNNDDYLDLVQELEETLQSRNRNRVRRAMQEFERRSRYNKPLEKPIINYDETSESEEPILQKINQLTSEKKMCCAGDMCTCMREKRTKPSLEKRIQSKPRPKPKGYPIGSRAPQMPQNQSKTRWQMDKTSGEWYKVSGNQHRGRFKNGRSRTPSPRRPCPQKCNCCGSKKFDYR